MPTSQKTEIVNELTKKFQDSSGIYLARYTGMDVDQATKIRKMFRENDVASVSYTHLTLPTKA